LGALRGSALQVGTAAESAVDSCEHLQLPRTYRVIRKLGQGGMGEIYLAKHLRRHLTCVIKVVRADKRFDPVAVRRFRTELQTLTSLNHPQIVRILDQGCTADGHDFVAMEYLNELNLEQFIERNGACSADQVISVLLKIASALSAVHAKGMNHGDVKPANIMASVGPGETIDATLIDFGLSTLHCHTDSGLSDTCSSGFVGSPLYAPPESAFGGVDARSDLYSLGATAYQLLVGRPVFDVVDPIRAVYAHAVQDPQSVRAIRADVSPALDAIVMKCLKKNPDERFQNVEELIEALNSLNAV